jgi:hypothetical protein
MFTAKGMVVKRANGEVRTCNSFLIVYYDVPLAFFFFFKKQNHSLIITFMFRVIAGNALLLCP